MTKIWRTTNSINRIYSKLLHRLATVEGLKMKVICKNKSKSCATYFSRGWCNCRVKEKRMTKMKPWCLLWKPKRCRSKELTLFKVFKCFSKDRRLHKFQWIWWTIQAVWFKISPEITTWIFKNIWKMMICWRKWWRTKWWPKWQHSRLASIILDLARSIWAVFLKEWKMLHILILSQFLRKLGLQIWQLISSLKVNTRLCHHKHYLGFSGFCS